VYLYSARVVYQTQACRSTVFSKILSARLRSECIHTGVENQWNYVLPLGLFSDPEVYPIGAKVVVVVVVVFKNA